MLILIVSLFNGMTRPDAPLLASSRKCIAWPKLPSASVTMSHVSSAISFARSPALTDSAYNKFSCS